MATIPTYPNLSPLTGTELIVISDVNNDNVTRTATVQQILDLTGSGVGNLQAVLTVGSDATSNMKLTGDFTLVGTLGANKVNAAGGDSNFSTIGNLTPGTIIGTDFEATGTGRFDTTLLVIGATTLAGLTAGDTTANSLVIDNGSSLQGTLTVGGVTTSNATFNDDLTVAATGTFSSSDVAITGGSIDGTDIGVTVTGDIFGDNIVNTDVNNDITPEPGGGLLPSSIGGVNSMTPLEYANNSNLNIEFTASNPAAAADYFTHTTPTFFKFTSIDLDAANIGIEVNNGLVELTGLSNDISDIDAGIDKTLTTKEWVEAQLTADGTIYTDNGQLDGARNIDMDSNSLGFTNASAGVSIGNATANTKSILDLDSILGTKGFKLPVWTTAQQISTTATYAGSEEGMTWFNTTTNQFMGWNGTTAVILG